MLFRKALHIFEALDDKAGMGNCYGNMVTVAKDSGNYDETLGILDSALALPNDVEEAADRIVLLLSQDERLHLESCDNVGFRGAILVLQATARQSPEQLPDGWRDPQLLRGADDLPHIEREMVLLVEGNSEVVEDGKR